MRIDRLQHLITILQLVPLERFSLRTWKCGTTACAVGWACMDPLFNLQGLIHYGSGPYYEKPDAEPNEFYTHWAAVEMFFGLDEEQALHLFSPTHYNNVRRPIPQDVIARIEALIQGNPQ